jgi:hypothetical protein
MRHCGQCDCAGRVGNGGLGQELPGGGELWVCANHPDRAGLLTLVACGDHHLEDVGTRCRSFRVRREVSGGGLPVADGSVRHIGLSGGLFAIVDAADFEGLSRYNWRATGGDSSYACCEIGGKKVYMHRLIMNPPAGMVVDHINGNRWDNRRGNLRVCTQAENLRNSRKSRGTSRFKGVFWDAVRRKWRAIIRYQGKTVHLGRFSDEVKAARAYDRAAVKLFGQYARLNFPEPTHIVWLSGRICVHSHASGRLAVITVSHRQGGAPCRCHPALKSEIETGRRPVFVFRSLEHRDSGHCFEIRDWGFVLSPLAASRGPPGHLGNHALKALD